MHSHQLLFLFFVFFGHGMARGSGRSARRRCGGLGRYLGGAVRVGVGVGRGGVSSRGCDLVRWARLGWGLVWGGVGVAYLRRVRAGSVGLAHWGFVSYE